MNVEKKHFLIQVKTQLNLKVTKPIELKEIKWMIGWSVNQEIFWSSRHTGVVPKHMLKNEII